MLIHLREILMKKLLLPALALIAFTNVTGCMSIISEIKNEREKAVADCDKFPKIKGHHLTYCPNTHYAIAKQAMGQYTLIKPTGEMSAYYDNITFSTRHKEQFYFIVKQNKQTGVMNLDGQMILPLDNYTGFISYDYANGFAVCGAFGSVGNTGYQKNCYDENGNKTTP